MPNRSTVPYDTRDPLVCVLAYDGLCAFEYGVALEVFGLPRPEFSRWYEFAVVAVEPGPLRALGGITVTGNADLSLLKRADVVIVPGWRGPEYPVPHPLTAALQVAHERGARLASICSGAFVLAATGLLDGKRATTHWRYAESLAIQHPSVEVVADVLYVVNNRVMTSAGSAAGLDLCLHIVRQDFGVDVANAVAHRLVLPAHRDGTQPQILAKPVVHELGGRVAPLLDRMRMSPDETWSVSRMAKVAGFSRRTFVRRFQDATGQTPHAWLASIRAAYALDLLQRSNRPLLEIARASGYGSVSTFRREIKRVYGHSPLALRSKVSTTISDEPKPGRGGVSRDPSRAIHDIAAAIERPAPKPA